MSFDRHSWRVVSLAAVGAAVLVAAGCGGGGGSKAAKQKPAPQKSKHVTALSPINTKPFNAPSDVERVWTPEAMENAKPYERTLPGSPPPGLSGGGTTGTAPAPENSVSGGSGAPPEKPTSNDASLAGAGASAPAFAAPKYAHLWRGSNRGIPAKTFGKIFFNEGNDTYVCSGTSVDSKNRSVVWTAGHCVVENGRVHQNWIFVPGYRHGQAPYGRWKARPANSMFSATAWIRSENSRFDVAAVVVSPVRGKTLEDVVGAEGIKFGLPPNQRFDAFGYPEAPPFHGEDLYWCGNSPVIGRDTPGTGGPPTLAIRCDMTGGSSGGGWIIGDYNGIQGWGWVNSVVSYHYNKLPRIKFGPYQGSVARQVWALASNS